MPAVAELLSYLIGLAGNILALLGVIRNAQQEQATSAEVATAAADAAATLAVVNSPSYGLNAIYTLLTTVHNQITALGAPQQAGSPVTLPATAPGGFLGSDGLSIADGCWNTIPSGFVRIMGDAMVLTAQSFGGVYTFNYPTSVGIFRVNNINYSGSDYYLPTFLYPTYDITNILETDSLLSMLTRQNPGWTVAYGWPPQTQVVLTNSTTPGVGWITSIDELDFQRIRDQLYPPANTQSPPIWPGLSKVTLGAPVALGSTFSVPGPMDGVLVAISSVPSYFGQFNFGTIPSWRHVGQIAFVSDNGDVEFPQGLGLEHAVYSPETMVSAASCVGRATAGVSGTVTPWTIN